MKEVTVSAASKEGKRGKTDSKSEENVCLPLLLGCEDCVPVSA